jgi:hypothetical protein
VVLEGEAATALLRQLFHDQTVLMLSRFSFLKGYADFEREAGVAAGTVAKQSLTTSQLENLRATLEHHQGRERRLDRVLTFVNSQLEAASKTPPKGALMSPSAHDLIASASIFGREGHMATSALPDLLKLATFTEAEAANLRDSATRFLFLHHVQHYRNKQTIAAFATGYGKVDDNSIAQYYLIHYRELLIKFNNLFHQVLTSFRDDAKALHLTEFMMMEIDAAAEYHVGQGTAAKEMTSAANDLTVKFAGAAWSHQNAGQHQLAEY